MAVDVAAFRKLAELFRPHATLYAVGGFCRDKLLGLEPRDLDICAKLTVKEVEKVLSNTDFAVHRRYPRLGTACVSCRGFTAEYTCFRTDSYREGSGEHHPADVTFTTDINLDAARRDFTANAVYFDPLTGEYVDPKGGIKDIADKVLRAADNPERVFSEDGLRILRLVRFAAETGFGVDGATMRAARKFASQVADIVRCMDSGQNGRVFRSGSHELLYGTERMKVYPLMREEEGELCIDRPGVYNFKGLRFRIDFFPKPAAFSPVSDGSVLYFAADGLNMPLLCRGWRPADRFRPFGMRRGSKKLSDFFTDLKLDRIQKQAQPVLLDADGSIVCLPGLRIDDRFKIKTPTTVVAGVSILSR